MKRYVRSAIVAVCFASPVIAQDVGDLRATAEPPERIDILVPMPATDAPMQEGRPGCVPPPVSDDSEDEIVVCGSPQDDNAFYYSGDAEAAEDRYAEETASADVIAAPGIAGPGIFTGPPTVGGMCGFGLNPCPPPVAYLIDFDDLPDAPEGSDARRVAEGLEPLDDPEARRDGPSDYEIDELGLPPAPEF